MSARKELWLKEYAAKLTRENTFYIGAKNDSEYVKAAGVITAPQSAGLPTIGTLTDGTSLPVTATKATFDYLEYSPATYTFGPIYVHNIDEAELSFDGMSAILDESVRALQEQIDYKIAYEWTANAVSGSLVTTTGTARTNIFGNASAKAITFTDITNANIALNKQNVPQTGRRLLVDAVGYGDIISLTQFIDASVIDRKAIVDGFVGRVGGFDVFWTTKLGSFVAAGTKKAIDATDLATDRSAAIAYHPSFVRYGVGTATSNGIGIKFTDPTGYFIDGQMMEGWARVGATPAYKDAGDSTGILGVVTIKEGV